MELLKNQMLDTELIKRAVEHLNDVKVIDR